MVKFGILQQASFNFFMICQTITSKYVIFLVSSLLTSYFVVKTKLQFSVAFYVP